MRKTLQKICLLAAMLCMGVTSAWAEEETVDFKFTSKDDLLGWTATNAPSSLESAGSARGLTWSKTATTLTYTLDGYGITHVKIVASANNAGYTIQVNSETAQDVAKSNNADYDFDVNVADGETVTITTTKNSSVKSFWIKSITFTKASGGVIVTKPTFSPAGGTYTEDQSVTISADEGRTIYYTTDGTTPSTESTVYSEAIELTVPSTTTIKAIAVDGENNASAVASATYTLKRSQYTPAQLLEEVTPDGESYTVVFDNEVITGTYEYKDNVCGYYFGEFLVYCSNDVPSWEVGGKVSGTVTGTWTTYSSRKEFCPTSYDDFNYTAPTHQLATPTNLSATNLTKEGTATLSWDAVENAKKYEVYIYGEGVDDTFEATTNSYNATGLTAGEDYMWTVKAIGDGTSYTDSEAAEGPDFTIPTTTEYQITLADVENGTIAAKVGDEEVTQAADGTTVTLVATPAEHYTLQAWDVYKSDDSETKVTVTDGAFVMPDYAVTVSATFQEDAKYTVTYSAGAEDATGDAPATVEYYAGDVVEIAENPFSRTGYTFNEWTIEPAVEVVEGLFEMPAENVTITATWTAKEAATITLMDKGTQYGEAVDAYVGDNLLEALAGVTAPAGWVAMADYSFAGWAQAKDTDDPQIVTAETTISGDITLYAVYAKVEGGSTSWDKVATTPSDWTGDYLLVYESSTTDGVAWTGVDAGQCHVDVTISDGSIASKPDDAAVLTIAAMTGGYSIQVNSGQYIGKSTYSNGMDFNSDALVNTLSIDDNGNAVITSAAGATIRYNKSSGSSNERFRYYKSVQQDVQLYKNNTTPGTTTYDFEESVKISISKAGWATVCLPYAAEISGAVAYKVGVDETTLVKTELTGVIPANEGVLIATENREAGTATFTPSEDEQADVEGNLLVGNAMAESVVLDESGYLYYKLCYGTVAEKSVLGFFWGVEEGTSITCPAYKAVLKVTESAGIKGFALDDETGVETVNGGRSTANANRYNLAGQKVSADYRGIVIVNGKKVLR